MPLAKHADSNESQVLAAGYLYIESAVRVFRIKLLQRIDDVDKAVPANVNILDDGGIQPFSVQIFPQSGVSFPIEGVCGKAADVNYFVGT